MKITFANRALPFALLGALAICLATPVLAQDAASPKFTVFAGPGISQSQGHWLSAIQAGASFEEAPPNSWAGLALEGGYLGPTSRLKSGSAFLSTNYVTSWAIGPSGKGQTANGKPYWSDRKWKLLPFASAGYTRLFGTGNAINFGGGLDYRPNPNEAIRFEVRDYYSFAQAGAHNIGFRVGWVLYLED